MVIQHIEDLKNRGQKVITCEYGPVNTQTNRSFAIFHFWYQAAVGVACYSTTMTIRARASSATDRRRK